LESRAVDVLVFVEDPGAVNFIVPLIPALEESGLRVKTVADGLARSIMASKGLPISTVDSARDWVKQTQPRLLLCGTSENLESLAFDLIKSARKENIPSIAVIDAAMNASRRFAGRSGNPLAHAPDFLLVNDVWTRDEYERIGFPKEHIHITGHPQYDELLALREQWDALGKSQMRAQVFPWAPVDKKLIVFIGEPNSGLEAGIFEDRGDYVLKGRGTTHKRTQIVLEECLDALKTIKSSISFVLRPHPKDRIEDYRDYDGEIDYLSRTEKAYEVVYAADLVVGITSSLIAEASLLGTPTLSIVPRAIEKEWLPNVRIGETPCAYSRKEVEAQLLTQLNLERRACGKSTPVARAGAVHRAVQAIMQRLSNNSNCAG
jgi:hypothetical protein